MFIGAERELFFAVAMDHGFSEGRDGLHLGVESDGGSGDGQVDGVAGVFAVDGEAEYRPGGEKAMPVPLQGFEP